MYSVRCSKNCHSNDKLCSLYITLKFIKLQRAKKLKSEIPSAVDDAADVMSKYSSKKNKVLLKDKKFSFPPIDYEKPPHF